MSLAPLYSPALVRNSPWHLDLQNWSFLANLAYGVTAGRDPQTGTNDTFAYQDLIDTGEIIGPQPYSTGPGIFPDTDFQSFDDADDVVRRYQKP